MTGLIQVDRWTCPTCGHTEVPNASDGAPMQRAIRRAQERHAARHRRALAEALRIAGGAA